MSKIRSAHTRPEMSLRRALHGKGFRYQLHPSYLPGRPDLVFRNRKAAVFVHGCFWHRHPGCKFAYVPKTRSAFWSEKFRDNLERDRRQVIQLKDMGWRLMIVWECALRDPFLTNTVTLVVRWLESDDSFVELPANSPRIPLKRSAKHNPRARPVQV
jgi:DNA mismatch endonuclease, patch repair protein